MNRPHKTFQSPVKFANEEVVIGYQFRSAFFIAMLLSVLAIAFAAAFAATDHQNEPAGTLRSPRSAQSNNNDVPDLPRAFYDRHDVTPEQAAAMRREDAARSGLLHRPLKDPGTSTSPQEIAVRINGEIVGPPDPIPVQDSAAVVIGEVTAARAFVTEQRTGAYSGYSIKVQRVLKQHGSSPIEAGTVMLATRTGATVLFPSGSVAHVYIAGRGGLHPGQMVVAFLHKDEDSGAYRLATAYDVSGGLVSPVDTIGRRYAGWPANGLVSLVQQLAASGDEQ